MGQCKSLFAYTWYQFLLEVYIIFCRLITIRILNYVNCNFWHQVQRYLAKLVRFVKKLMCCMHCGIPFLVIYNDGIISYIMCISLISCVYNILTNFRSLKRSPSGSFGFFYLNLGRVKKQSGKYNKDDYISLPSDTVNIQGLTRRKAAQVKKTKESNIFDVVASFVSSA